MTGTVFTGHADGAGVVLLEMYNDRKNGRRGPAVIMFRNTTTGKFADAGGVQSSQNEGLLQCAERELREKSAGLFRVGLRGAIRYEVRHRGYAAFIVPVTGPPSVGIQKRRYDYNVSRLRMSPGSKPHGYMETDGMTRFFVADLASAGVSTMRGDLRHVPDVYGVSHTIDARAKAVLREALLEHPGVMSWGAGLRPNLLRQEPDGMCRRGRNKGELYCYWC